MLIQDELLAQPDSVSPESAIWMRWYLHQNVALQGYQNRLFWKIQSKLFLKPVQGDPVPAGPAAPAAPAAANMNMKQLGLQTFSRNVHQGKKLLHQRKCILEKGHERKLSMLINSKHKECCSRH